MLKNLHIKDKHCLKPMPPTVVRKNSYNTAHKSSSFEPKGYSHNLAGFPVRSLHKISSESSRREYSNANPNPITSRESSIDQIKSKLKEYLGKTQQNSLLNYHNESLLGFNHRAIHEHFRMTLFRNNLKKRINLHIIDSAFAERYESTPEFNVSEAVIIPRAQKRFEESGKLFHPKREYFIHHHHHHQKRKEKIPIPQSPPPKTVYPLTNRQCSLRERERGGVGVEPWRRWGKDSEEGDIVQPEDP